MKETLVSCFFNLKKKEGNDRKGLDVYMKHGQFILSRPVNLVLFVDKDVAVECQMIRHNYHLHHKTHIIPMEVEDLPYYQYLPRVIEARKMNPMVNGSSSKDTPLFTLLTWCKFAFLIRAIEENHFHSTHFGWVDFGITHVAKTDYVEKDKIFSGFPDGIKLLTLRNMTPQDLSPNNGEFEAKGGRMEFIKKHYYGYERGIVAAGYMTGAIPQWKLFHKLFEKEIFQLLDEGFAPSEQQVLPILILKNPSLFLTYRGDYDAILTNYKFFHTSLHNVTTYTLKRARQSRRNMLNSAKTGSELFRAIFNGEYDMENESPQHVLEFIQELYALLVLLDEFENADVVKDTYQDIIKDEKYKNIQLKEELIPLL